MLNKLELDAMVIKLQSMEEHTDCESKAHSGRAALTHKGMTYEETTQDTVKCKQQQTSLCFHG